MLQPILARQTPVQGAYCFDIKLKKNWIIFIWNAAT